MKTNIIKTLIYLVSFFLLLAFVRTCVRLNLKKQHETPSELKKEYTKTCDNYFTYGNVDICLPEVDSMVECFKIPIIRTFIQETTNSETMAYATYINKDTYINIDNIDYEKFNDYFIIYGTKKAEFYNANEDDLVEAKIYTLESEPVSGWFDSINNGVNSSYLSDSIVCPYISDSLLLDQPINIERFIINENQFTVSRLLRTQLFGYEQVFIEISNVLLIRQRLIILKYCNFFVNNESYKLAIVKNNSFVKLLIDANK